MAERQYRTLTKRAVDRLSVNGKDAVFRDDQLPGFGVRVYPSGKKVFVVRTRAFGRSKRVSLGAHGDTGFSVDHARKKATDIIARIKTGQPPVDPEPASDPTVADLAGRYEREYVAMHCKPLTVRHCRLMLRKHIVPALGERRVTEVECKDILAFHNSLHRMPTVANRAADILVKMFNLADAWGWRPSGSRSYERRVAAGAHRIWAARHRNSRWVPPPERGARTQAGSRDGPAITSATARIQVGCAPQGATGASAFRPGMTRCRTAPSEET